MKKIFTFIAIAFLALAAQAQTSYPPVITWTADDGVLTITATGDGFVMMEVEIGEEIYNRTGEDEATFVKRYDVEEGVTVYVRAYIGVDGQPVSDYAEETIVVPPVSDVPTPDAPEITWTAVDGVLTITATGDGFVMLEVEVGPDATITRTGMDEAYYIMQYDPEEGVSVHARACIWQNAEPVSDYAEETIVVPPVTPEAPVITWTADDGLLTITATGDGFVMLQIEGGNDSGITRTGFGEAYYIMHYDPEEGVTVYARACIWQNNEPVSDYTEETIVVPASGVNPMDPHMRGHWLVIRDMFDIDNWFELQKGANGDYVTSVSLEYYVYGLYDPETEADVPFYFMIDGVHYGAANETSEANLGQAMENPLYESDGYYTVPVGYAYSLGIAIIEGEMYVYASQAYPTSVDEVNTGKTVAGVRYFNMAGQEMKEANGMTIVVTTYTDGTTSAAKVIK